MNRILFLMAICLSFLNMSADDYMETFNSLSDDYQNSVYDVQVIRQINGGTVIIPVFDSSCPKEMEGPFSYACKIVEEYMPPCLPLKIKVACGRVNSSVSGVISKVRALTKENFGKPVNSSNATMATIKGVILGEMNYGSTSTYLDSVPNLDFLTELPDIEITYSNSRLDEMSFSLEPDPGDKYDFVSLAIRDILTGLGFISNYRYDPVNHCLLNPSQEMLPFEAYINDALGANADSDTRFRNATQGELTLKFPLDLLRNLRLYAPATWINGLSLNYFVPQDNCDISKILSYDFCKGMVRRSLNDNHMQTIFQNLLGWKYDFGVSTDTSGSSNSGSTELKMPYNGTLTIPPSRKSPSYIPEATTETEIKRISQFNNDDPLYLYLDQYRLCFPFNITDKAEGTHVSILKKDGTWDVVMSTGENSYVNFSMSSLRFNCDPDEYARTMDGYIRAKVTIEKRNGKYFSFENRYFVIDYLPQTINLQYSKKETSLARTQSSDINGINTENPVRLFFSNLEGTDRVVLETLKKGSRVPTKVEITDFKKGYYDTNISVETTFTAVGYNANGYSRSVPVTVVPQNLEIGITDPSIKVDQNTLVVSSNGEKFYYEIKSIANPDLVLSGTTTATIDISSLPTGAYVLVLINTETQKTHTYKFIKK